MLSCTVPESQQSAQATPAGQPAAGSWTLGAGRVLSLHPLTPGVLAIASGCAWVTVRGGGVDHVLQAGEELAIAPGQHVVLEPWGTAGRADAVAFRWDASAGGRATARHPRAMGAAACDWQCGVVQPLSDLLRALGLGGRAVGSAALDVAGAAGRLAAGLARFALNRIAVRAQHRPV